ncbi:hypothetical protein AAFF_G00229820 [Aldrovandia affinis]|uniref:Uncharacterized protein n=1 Tax=Aldrovandia affinis TaxID=143900 RepID=A0AAD7SXD2_9TELE|nr:hypothetical protein AAFF_G00229820 [Aldrovandia affinis]
MHSASATRRRVQTQMWRVAGRLQRGIASTCFIYERYARRHLRGVLICGDHGPNFPVNELHICFPARSAASSAVDRADVFWNGICAFPQLHADTDGPHCGVLPCGDRSNHHMFYRGFSRGFDHPLPASRLT